LHSAAQRYTPATTDVDPVPMHASCSAEANADIDRGAAFLMLLAASDARRAFSRAADTDPDCALAYWGQATSTLPTADEPLTLATLDAGRSIVLRARATKARTPIERGLVAAVAELVAPSAPATLGVRLEGYEQRLRALADAHPATPIVQVLHARAALLRSTLPGDTARARAATVLEAAFRDPALFAGAAVTLLQATDASTSPAQARRAAEGLMGTRLPAPQHLALRTFVKLGDWPNAVRAGESALKYAGSPSSPALLYGARRELAVEWLVETWLQQGKRSAARTLVSRLEAELGRADASDDAVPAVRLGLARAAARVTLDERDWTAPAAPAPSPEPEALAWPLGFAHGLLAGWRAWPGGDAQLLRLARVHLGALANASSARTADPEIELARVLTEAAVAASQDEHPQVTLLVTHAAELETRLEQTGRLSLPLLPARGLAAEIWQRFYRYPDAEREARATLERYPNRWRAWITLARACNLQDEMDEAHAAYRRVAEIRAGADAGDPALDEARRALDRRVAPASTPPPRDR
jgi:tetratricopeptide (TPR) repeat protein